MARLSEHLSKLHHKTEHPESAEKNHDEPNPENGACSNSGSRIPHTHFGIRRMQQTCPRQHCPDAARRSARGSKPGSRRLCQPGPRCRPASDVRSTSPKFKLSTSPELKLSTGSQLFEQRIAQLFQSRFPQP